jgi:hypothetical protein
MIVLISRFQVESFSIITSGYVYFVIACAAWFDCLLMQLVDFVFGKYSSKPLSKQYPEVEQKFSEGYRAYNDVTLVSVVYPLFKWIFG